MDYVDVIWIAAFCSNSLLPKEAMARIEFTMTYNSVMCLLKNFIELYEKQCKIC